jgi:hypothetical protein
LPTVALVASRVSACGAPAIGTRSDRAPGDKAGDWSGWYRGAIPRAEHLYSIYLKERAAEESP